jgi:hypothetical protein
MPQPEYQNDASHRSGGRRAAPASRTGVVAPIALAVALVGTALAGLALYRSMGETPPASVPAPVDVEQPNAADQQSGDAKAHLCEAFGTVRQAVALQTHLDLGTDPVALQAVAANARLAMVGGAYYLQSRIEPGAPDDLVSAIHSFTDALQAVGVNALAGITNADPAQAARLQDAQVVSERIVEQCK